MPIESHKRILPALQIQLILALGYFFALLWSIFYIIIDKEGRFPAERPLTLVFGCLTSLLLFIVGYYLSKKTNNKNKISKLNLQDGVIIVFLVWLIACSISAMVFVMNGIPIPGQEADFSLIRRFFDGFFESMSGFTTTGASIMPNVEAFSRGLLMWRETTHWIGGMGIAYLFITIWHRFFFNRGEIISAESETHVTVHYNNEKEAILSGKNFLKAYSLLSFILLLALFASGLFFRITPYLHWYDSLYDAVIHTFGAMGTGGFSSYNSSVGLPVDQTMLIGGLQNKVSEWILVFGMLFAGMNFSLWYIAFFNAKNWRQIFKNQELKTYLAVIIILTLGIWSGLNLSKEFLAIHSQYQSPLDSLRYAFFNVNTIITTTGFGNTDFTKWPSICLGFLFVAFLLGSCVGSTGGGLKIIRFLVTIKYSFIEIKNVIFGTNRNEFTIDEIKYNRQSVALIIVNIVFYLMIFLLGGVLIMVLSQKVVFVDGSSENIDFISAMMASLATLGNIGPAATYGAVDDGPNGNYFAYSVAAKILMSFLMYFGRVGVLTIVFFFITKKGEKQLSHNTPEIDFDSDLPLLIK